MQRRDVVAQSRARQLFPEATIAKSHVALKPIRAVQVHDSRQDFVVGIIHASPVRAVQHSVGGNVLDAGQFGCQFKIHGLDCSPARASTFALGRLAFMETVPAIDSTEFEFMFEYVSARCDLSAIRGCGLSGIEIISKIDDAISERYTTPDTRRAFLFRWLGLYRLASKGLLPDGYYRRGDRSTPDWLDGRAIRLAASFPVSDSGRFDPKPFLESLQEAGV